MIGKTKSNLLGKSILNERWAGDFVNVLSIVSMIAFSATVAAQIYGWTDIFDDSFMRDGFCVAN